MQPVDRSNGSPGVRTAVRREGRLTVLSVGGDVDLATATTLSEQIRTVLGHRPPILVLDLTDVEFLASAGLQVLVDAYRTAPSTRVAVVAAGPATRRPITMTELHQLLELYPSLDKARAALGGD
ncbi:STAS domain-containing protein [Mycolicibacterium grossiae]|uniref:STAS domain-containing protein n=1 Tax=Mycolicibacterium grossiae TaxID=1552759 RepID=UPI0009F72295|nr:STAS domain-containing protein [Mycolicibacterium grossiae]QEM48068.1 STAS domain-containing protein [Mycolicibacterium grossiae]